MGGGVWFVVVKDANIDLLNEVETYFSNKIRYSSWSGSYRVWHSDHLSHEWLVPTGKDECFVKHLRTGANNAIFVNKFDIRMQEFKSVEKTTLKHAVNVVEQ